MEIDKAAKTASGGSSISSGGVLTIGVEDILNAVEGDPKVSSLDPGKDLVSWDKVERGLGVRMRPNCDPVWIVQWRQDGVSVKRKVGATSEMNRHQAIERARRIRSEYVAAGNQGNGKKRCQFQHFAKTFLRHCRHQWRSNTFNTNSRLINRELIPHFREKLMDEVTRADVFAWRASPGGHCNRSLSVLSSIFNHAETLGIRDFGSNPCEGMRRKKSQFRAVYPTERNYRQIGAALKRLESRNKVIVSLVKFLALTGARRGEAIGLKWDDIDGPRARLRDSKSGPSVIWMAYGVRTLLEGFKKGKPRSYVFAAKSRRKLNSDLTRFWSALRQELGLGRMRIHDLRHGYASTGVSCGEDLRVVGQLLGHRDPNTTLAYAHLQGDAVAAAGERVCKKLDQHLNGNRALPTRSVLPTKEITHEKDAYGYLDRFSREGNPLPGI